MDLFRSTFGLGSTGTINFYKYSPQRECFIGFDQAYVKTELSERDFFKLLKDSAASSGYKLSSKFIGYFLQFKVVKELQIRKKYTPAGITSRPLYRVALDTTKNINTGLSQHELLFNLNKNSGAMVYYACPMLFDRSSLYDVEVDLDSLRLADLDSCPSSYTDNDNHFIYFNTPTTTPIWCSDPVDGRAVLPSQLAEMLIAKLRQVEFAQSATDLFNVLTNLESVGLSPKSEAFKERAIPSILSLVAESLTIVKITTPDAQPFVPGDAAR